MTDIKKGDRVKVTIEGVVDRLDGDKWLVLDHHDIHIPTATIEKIEPPVEVFKAGDVVRAKHGGALIALGLEGYTYLQSRYLQPGKTFSHQCGYQAEDFTSESFEKVTIE